MEADTEEVKEVELEGYGEELGVTHGEQPPPPYSIYVNVNIVSRLIIDISLNVELPQEHSQLSYRHRASPQLCKSNRIESKFIILYQ